MRNPFKSSGTIDAVAIEQVVESDTSSSIDKKFEAKHIDVVSEKADLANIQKSHQNDPNLPQGTIDAVNKAIKDDDSDEIARATELFSDNSPYEEVRAAVRNTDGEEVANTVRAWILGMFFVTIGSGLNMFLSLRYGRFQSKLIVRT